jgi:hypothetical protein
LAARSTFNIHLACPDALAGSMAASTPPSTAAIEVLAAVVVELSK